MTDAVVVFDGEASYALAPRALECSDCRRTTSCLINRDGATRCYDCDAARQDRKAAGRKP